MGMRPSAELVFGFKLGSPDTETRENAAKLGIITEEQACDYDTDLEMYELCENFASNHGLEFVIGYSWEWSELYICAKEPKYTESSTIPFELGSIDSDTMDKLEELSKKIGKKLKWHLVPFYG